MVWSNKVQDGPVAGSFKHVDETSSSVKAEEFVELLSKSCLHKKVSAT
jgi:hypothetical protein